MKLVERTKMPLHWAARLLSDLCDQVDNSPEMTHTMIQAIQSAGVALAEAIDRRKALMWAIDGSLKAARGARAEIDSYVQRLKGIQELLKETTKQAMEADPNLPWKDSVGRKLTLSANSQPSLKLDFDMKDKRTFTNLVHDETVAMFDIPPRFLNRITVTTLNSDALKAALAAGQKISWAELEHGRHVRGLMPKQEEVEDAEPESN